MSNLSSLLEILKPLYKQGVNFKPLPVYPFYYFFFSSLTLLVAHVMVNYKENSCLLLRSFILPSSHCGAIKICNRTHYAMFEGGYHVTRSGISEWGQGLRI